jgi:hypothetical protein
MRLPGFDPSVGSFCSPFSELPLTNWKSIFFRFYGKTILILIWISLYTTTSAIDNQKVEPAAN